MRHILVLTILSTGSFALFPAPLRAEGLQESTKKFVYKDASGRVTSVKIIHHYWTKPIVHPFAKIDPRLDPKLARAATLGASRLILGAPQRNALLNLLRGNVIREVSSSLPEEIDLLVYA